MSRINRRGRRIVAAAVTAGAVAAGTSLTGGILGASALAETRISPVSYGFRTLDNQADPTFNQLLGINNAGMIAGYFGSGAAGHPNQGYRLLPPTGTAATPSENFPGSVQTQVTGLNNRA